ACTACAESTPSARWCTGSARTLPSPIRPAWTSSASSSRTDRRSTGKRARHVHRRRSASAAEAQETRKLKKRVARPPRARHAGGARGRTLVIDHVGFPVSDYERSKRFYEQALAPLGYTLV